MPGGMRLKELIKKIRACKTAQEERDVVTKECAVIRTSFKEEDAENRARNVAKLLYIHLLGFPAHFGQLECLKLIASSRFTDKRIGYLGAMMLLDERQDVHILMTQSLKNDMNHQVQYVQSLSLCALGTIASQEMSRDLSQEVEGLLKSSNNYVKKKAALCAVRIIRKVPDLMEMFVPMTRPLLAERNHGVLVGAVGLVEEMCAANPESVTHFRKFVPNLVRILKNLIMSSYSPEHDVSGVCDPFLQVQILRVFRTLARNDKETSELLYDILAQVATNTEGNKNAAHSVLYETVRTIMEIKSESGLRVLGVNILGRFLLSSERNIRYIALNTLLRTMKVDYNAVQRHRKTIVDCLKENDISIRRRALELSFALINEKNIQVMMKDILELLEEDADEEFKPYITSNVIAAAEKYAPDKRWHIDTVLTVLIIAGGHVRDDLVSDIVQLISATSELQGYIVQRLYKALEKNPREQPLVRVGAWAVGEHADLLVSGDHLEDEPMQVSEEDVVIVMEDLIRSPGTSPVTRVYIMNALMKLTARLSSAVSPRLNAVIRKYKTSINSELQQRAVEYDKILVSYGNLKNGLLEKMPAMSSIRSEEREGEEGSQQSEQVLQMPNNVAEKSQQGGGLLDLLGGGDTPTEAPPTNPPPSSGMELLDLLGGNPMETQPSVVSSGDQPNALLDLLGSAPLNDTGLHPQPTTGIPSIVAFDKNGLKVTFTFNRDPANPTSFTIHLTAVNATANTMTDFLFQAAVPKAFQMQMMSPSGNTLPPSGGGVVTQDILINNPQQQTLRMRMRITFTINGTSTLEQGEVSDFPPELLSAM
jgi:AP-1 complex subunit gamma-1